MPDERVIYLPEAVIEDLLGRRLVRDVPQLFEYNGGLYRAGPRIPCGPMARFSASWWRRRATSGRAAVRSSAGLGVDACKE